MISFLAGVLVGIVGTIAALYVVAHWWKKGWGG